jgi:hypothetical protein
MRDLFLITSVINTGSKPWSYTSIRSMYSTQERFEQTLETIASIRKYSPDAIIVIAECSDLSQEYTNTLTSQVDYFLNLYTDDRIRSICLESNMKGYGEGVQTKYVIEFLMKNNIQFHRFFKISGRYTLNEKFKSENFLDDRYTFKRRVITGDNQIAMSTIVYSFPYPFINNFNRVLDKVIEHYETKGPKGYEELLPIRCEPRSEIETIGVSGYIAVTQNELIHA